MTVSEALDNLWETIKTQSIVITMDDEDLIIYALNYLGANLDHAFEEFINEKEN